MQMRPALLQKQRPSMGSTRLPSHTLVFCSIQTSSSETSLRHVRARYIRGPVPSQKNSQTTAPVELLGIYTRELSTWTHDRQRDSGRRLSMHGPRLRGPTPRSIYAEAAACLGQRVLQKPLQWLIKRVGASGMTETPLLLQVGELEEIETGNANRP